MDKNTTGRNTVVKLFDLTGKELTSKIIDNSNEKENYINLYGPGIEKGIYIVKVENGYSNDFKKLVVK